MRAIKVVRKRNWGKHSLIEALSLENSDVEQKALFNPCM